MYAPTSRQGERFVKSKQGARHLLFHRSAGLIGLLLLGVFLMGASPMKYTEDRLPSTLNPVFADEMYSVRVTEMIFERLIGWDKDQRLRPMLATSWKLAADKKSIIMNLRKNVKWHDGKPFTAKDVEFTIKVMKGGRRSQIADRYLSQIVRSVKVMGSHQLKINFKKSLNKPLKWLQFKIIPKHRFKGKRVTRYNYFSRKPYGTGPFKLKKWVGRKVILRRFSQHWRASNIKLKGVSLNVIPDKSLQVEILRYGGIDAIIRVRPKDVTTFERDQNMVLYPYQTNDWWYIALNQKRGSIFRDPKVREAIVYALDRDSIRTSHLGEGQTISGPFSPNDPLYNFNVSPRTQDLAKAKSLLTQAGWKGSGIRSKGGKKLKINLVLPKSKNSYKPLVLAIQSEMRKVGIQLELVWLGDVAWRKRVFNKKNFDMALHIWNFDDLSTIYPLFHSKGGRNYVSFRSKQVDKLLNLSTRTTDPAIYRSIFKKLHKILHKELPYVFLWSLTNYSAISSRIKGVSIHPFNYFHYVYGWKKK